MTSRVLLKRSASAVALLGVVALILFLVQLWPWIAMPDEPTDLLIEAAEHPQDVAAIAEAYRKRADDPPKSISLPALKSTALSMSDVATHFDLYDELVPVAAQD